MYACMHVCLYVYVDIYIYTLKGVTSQVVTGEYYIVVVEHGLFTDDLPTEHGNFA